MQTLMTIDAVKTEIKKWKKQGLTIGFVPTMGYLHEGHQSLIEHARRENDRVVVSIFVNPIQFCKNEDLATYPRDLAHDQAHCQQIGCDLLFIPTVEEMYPTGFSTYIDHGDLAERLCGAKRPGHFRGVCTVVVKLFNIITPDHAYFGQKDAQQVAVIRQMVRDLNSEVTIVSCPTVREADGLAKSSRNSYLSESERQAATIIYQAILLAQKLLKQGESQSAKITQAMVACLAQQPLAVIDYLEWVDKSTLQPQTKINAQSLCVMAIYIGKTRLIDNFEVSQIQ